MDFAKEFGKKLWDELQPKIKGAIDSWSDDEKELVKKCAEDAAKVVAMAAAGVDLAPEKAQIDAQLANIKVSAQQSVSKTFWTVASHILKIAAATLLK